MSGLPYISPIHASIVVVGLPLLAFLLQAIRGKKSTSGLFALVSIALSTLISGLFVLPQIWQEAPVTATVHWFTIGDKVFTLGVLLNNLSALMQFIVCIIALPVHIYSKAYMKGDPGIHRYWMYLSLFCFAMLGLTVSKNLFMMYVFWELVGIASYLLIGFWFTKDTATEANKKAFIVNRIGDIGFLIGISVLFSLFGTLDLVDLFGSEGVFATGIDKNTGLITLAGICFFLGAVAKSAQFPLHVWLPDAMEGPTSVSSLIHAATMVAAGVFLMASIFPLFNADVLLLMAITGTITAVSAAYFALCQYDIKKVLAFSTISQLGYMIAAVGIGAWDAAMFHLATHAFFKCLLFLCAGAVIHEMVHHKEHTKLDFDPQDLRHMGGLRRYMPKTFVLMSIASLALAGFPLTSGYLSKDAIIIAAFEWAAQHGPGYMVIPVVLVIVSILTAFYIGRLIFKAFFGQIRIPQKDQQAPHIHEASQTMLVPMTFLGVGSLFFAFSLNPLSYHHAEILAGFSVHYTFEEIHSLHVFIPIILTVGALCSWILAWRWYVKGKYPLQANIMWIVRGGEQFGLDEFYKKTFVNGTLALGMASQWWDKHVLDGLIVHGAAHVVKSVSRATYWIDKYIVDGLVNTIAGTTYYIGHLLRWVQNGRIQNYFGFAFTIILIGIVYLIFR